MFFDMFRPQISVNSRLAAICEQYYQRLGKTKEAARTLCDVRQAVLSEGFRTLLMHKIKGSVLRPWMFLLPLIWFIAKLTSGGEPLPVVALWTLITPFTMVIGELGWKTLEVLAKLAKRLPLHYKEAIILTLKIVGKVTYYAILPLVIGGWLIFSAAKILLWPLKPISNIIANFLTYIDSSLFLVSKQSGTWLWKPIIQGIKPAHLVIPLVFGGLQALLFFMAVLTYAKDPSSPIFIVSITLFAILVIVEILNILVCVVTVGLFIEFRLRPIQTSTHVIIQTVGFVPKQVAKTNQWKQTRRIMYQVIVDLYHRVCRQIEWIE